MKLENDNTNIAKLTFKGRIDSVTSPAVELQIQDAIDKDPLEIVLDFQDVDYISSAALRVLLAANKKCRAKEIQLKVANMNEIVREVIHVTGFSSLFQFI